jgi:hypothetical protein
MISETPVESSSVTPASQSGSSVLFRRRTDTLTTVSVQTSGFVSERTQFAISTNAADLLATLHQTEERLAEREHSLQLAAQLGQELSENESKLLNEVPFPHHLPNYFLLTILNVSFLMSPVGRKEFID